MRVYDKTHKNKFRSAWFTKLCDPTLYVNVKVCHWWKDVDCQKCLALAPKSSSRASKAKRPARRKGV